MNKLLVICGPTATGKTALGIKLAKKYNGEIVSADSRQVYKGMDIGTGKDFNKFSIFNFQFSIKDQYRIGYHLIDGIKIWLYDIVEPNYKFSVADYVKCAKLVINDIWKRKKLPILVGGTGFYIKAIVDGIETVGIPPDWELREKLRNEEIKKLREILKKLRPQRLAMMNKSDRNNPRRLIRAIEIASKCKMQNSKCKPCLLTRLPDGQAGRIEIQNLKFSHLLIIGLKGDYKELYRRIDERVEKRVRQGVVEEIQVLLKKGYSWKNSVLGETIGYREWKNHIPCCVSRVSCHESKDEVIQKWKLNEHAYARRQMTWFRGEKRIKWFDITQKSWQDKVEKLINKWYSNN